MAKIPTKKELNQLQKNALDGIRQALQDAAKADYTSASMMDIEAWINYADEVNEYYIKIEAGADEPAPHPPYKH